MVTVSFQSFDIRVYRYQSVCWIDRGITSYKKNSFHSVCRTRIAEKLDIRNYVEKLKNYSNYMDSQVEDRKLMKCKKIH